MYHTAFVAYLIWLTTLHKEIQRCNLHSKEIKKFNNLKGWGVGPRGGASPYFVEYPYPPGIQVPSLGKLERWTRLSAVAPLPSPVMVSSSTCNLIFRVPNVFMGGESPNHLPRWDSQFFNYLALNLSTGKIISILFTRDLGSFGIFPGSVLLLGNLCGLCLCLELQISNQLLICCGTVDSR